MAQTTSNPNADTGPEKQDSLSLPTKTATLQFFDGSDPKWATEKPFYSNIPFTQTKIANTNVINTSARVQISDARGHESEFTLDKNGFQLVKWKHRFSDVGPCFQEEGYPAVVKFMKDVLGSHVKVCVFDHIVSFYCLLWTALMKQVRQSQPRGSAPGEEKGYIGRPSKVAHNDQTYEGTIAKIKHDFGSQASSILSQRFRIINDQSDEEVWLIKTMDSLARSEDVAMYTPHTSFFDEDPAVAEEIRESIELRVYSQPPKDTMEAERSRSRSRGRPTDADKKRYEDDTMSRESSLDSHVVCPQPTKAQPWKQALQVEKDSGTNPFLNWEPNAMDFGEKPWLKIDWSKIEGTGPGGVRSKSPDQMCGYSVGNLKLV
ncbi:hypothetical protein FOVSG1_002199 [Fusarium oxysporum f. sp. vasinfectum]